MRQVFRRQQDPQQIQEDSLVDESIHDLPDDDPGLQY
jgi:hypothetical protein